MPQETPSVQIARCPAAEGRVPGCGPAPTFPPFPRTTEKPWRRHVRDCVRTTPNYEALEGAKQSLIRKEIKERRMFKCFMYHLPAKYGIGARFSCFRIFSMVGELAKQAATIHLDSSSWDYYLSLPYFQGHFWSSYCKWHISN